MASVIKNFINSLFDPSGKDLLLLPEKIKQDLSVSFNDDEDIVISMKTERSIYRAASAKDSNTFYKTFAIITNKRVVLAKDSSSLKIFREIPLDQVNSLLYEEVNNKPTIHIDALNAKYILSMPPRSFDEAKIFFDKFNETHKSGASEAEYCRHCGKKILQDSVYCSHCGEKIN